MTRKRKKSRPFQFQQLAMQLEKALGLGGKKTQTFIERLSKDLSPTLNKLETAILMTQSLPFGLIKELFETTIKRNLKDLHPSFESFKKTGDEMLCLMKDWIQPDLFFESLKRIANLYLFQDQSESEVDEFGMDHSVLEAVRPLFEFLYYDYWRIEAKGIENIPKSGRCMLVGNHSGMLPYDGAMITVACLNEHRAKRHLRFLIEDFVYHFPFLGTFMSRIGAVRACPENATWLLKKGQAVLVFPEGVKGLGKLYEERYQLKRFGRGGFIKIAIKTQTPIIPVAVIGAEEIHPIIWKSSLLAKAMNVPYLPVTPTFPWLGPLGLLPLPTKWTIQFGKPIPFNTFKPVDAENGLLVQSLTEKVEHRIQRMIDLQIKKRKSVWLG